MATLDCLIQHLKELREKAGKDVPLYVVDRDLIPIPTGRSFQAIANLGQPNNRLTYEPDPHSPRGVIIYTGK
jgi:hypothetical protein